MLMHRPLLPVSCVAYAALALLVCAIWGTPQATAGPRYFSAEDGVAIRGYDPVSFFIAEAPERGQRDHAVMWKGAIWLFRSAENQSRFESNPRAYAPRFGGHCAYGMARGLLFDGDPLSWEIVDGRLFLFHNPRVETLWQADPDQMIQSARAVWPSILRQE